MQNINKILLFFLAFVVVIFIAAWEVLQSHWVATRVSSMATKYIEQVYRAQVEFEALDFQLYPPGAELKNVKVRSKEHGVDVEANVSRVGLYFNPFDVFHTEFIIDEVLIDDGWVKVDLKESDKKDDGKVQVDVNQLNVLENVPLNVLKINELDLKYNDYSAHFNYANLDNLKNKIGLDISVSNLKIKNIQELNSIDSIRLKTIVKPKVLNIDLLKINSGYSFLELNGQIENYISKNIEYKLKGSGEVFVTDINDIYDISDIGKLERGQLLLDLNINGIEDEFKINTKLNVSSLVSDFIVADSLVADLIINNKEIGVNSLKMKNNKEELNLLDFFSIYSFEKKEFIPEPIKISATEFEIENALRYLRNDFDLLKGKISGQIEFLLKKNGFIISPINDVIFNELRISLNEKVDVFNAQRLELENYSKFILDKKAFSIDSGLKNGETTIKLTTLIKPNFLDINIPYSYIDLKHISPMFGFDTQGIGQMKLNLKKIKESDLILSNELDLNDFNFSGYSLDKIRSKIELNLTKNKLYINSVNGKSNDSIITSKGHVDLTNLGVDLDYSVKDLTYAQAKKIFDPILGGLELSESFVQGKISTTGKVTGQLTPKKINVSGSASGRNIFVHNDIIDRLNFSYKYFDQDIELNEIKLEKQQGVVRGNVVYDFEQNRLDVKSQIKSLNLQDFNIYNKTPLNLRAIMDGYLDVTWSEKSYDLKTDLKLSQTKSFYVNYPDSNIFANIKNNSGSIDLRFFDDQIRFKSSLTDSRLLDTTVSIKSDEVEKLFAILKGIDINTAQIEGAVDYKAEFLFDLQKKVFKMLKTNMKKLSLKKDLVSIDYTLKDPEIIVEDYKIIKWDVNIRGRNFQILSKGDGNLKKNFSTNTRTKIDASFLEVFTDVFSKVSGQLRSKLIWGVNDNKLDYELHLIGNKLNINSPFIPANISEGNILLSLDNKKIDIKRFDANVGKGKLRLNGLIDIGKFIPDVNIRYSLDGASVNILKKSEMILSGNGSFIGSNFPYTLGGDVTIDRFVIVNEITDFTGNSSSFKVKEIDFLPSEVEKDSNQFVSFNLNINTREPVYIKNTLADLGAEGSVRLLGGENDMRLSGSIRLAPRKNYVTFKNTQFNFSKGSVVFSDRNKISNPELDFHANASIRDYNIFVKLFGLAEDFQLNLSSEPALSQSDIFSLIAFGYTDDISNNISVAERENMTRAGVGSIIFDSFKINETLKNEFGIQVNLGTDVTEEQGSYLSQRNSDSSVGKVRTATTFEIKKQINDAMSLSVSSTVGDNSNQKQSMNLNYNINNKVSVEGVYESRSTDEAQTLNDDTSVGADIKWKWSFK